MARQPYYRTRLNAWYIRHEGKDIRLGTDKKEAEKRWRELRDSPPVPTPAPVPKPSLTVADLAEKFLAWCGQHRAPKSVELYERAVNSFVATVEGMTVEELRPQHVTDWLAAHKWGDTSANMMFRCLARSFNWAVKYGHIPANPVKGAERPAAHPREVYITPEQWGQTTAAIDPADSFLDLVMFLRLTGCRPMEARIAEARHFNGKVITYEVRRSKGKRRQRVIVLNAAALAIVQRLAWKYPEGPLFRNEDGNPWTNDAINCRFARLKRKLGFKIFAYAIRATYATDALMAGIEPLTVAHLLGHSSITMLWQHYQRLQLQSNHMRDAAERAVVQLVMTEVA